MDLLTILIIVGVGGACFYFWQNQQKQKPTENKPLRPFGSEELRIENVGPGAVIHLTGIGKEMEDFDLKVISKHTYRQGESSWYEFECDKGEEKVWLDMEEDDEIELAVGLRKLKLRELTITKEDLVRFDEKEEGSFEFEGRKYWLEDSDSAVFYRHSNDKEAEKFYYWDFEDDSGKNYIGIEKWSDGSYDITYSEAIKPSQLTVYSIR